MGMSVSLALVPEEGIHGGAESWLRVRSGGRRDGQPSGPGGGGDLVRLDTMDGNRGRAPALG